MKNTTVKRNLSEGCEICLASMERVKEKGKEMHFKISKDYNVIKLELSLFYNSFLRAYFK